ncbi:helix-turn-helix domain-containing protein [Hyphobacterium sp.]|uniref:helix-turn-helix domain-containing protein n=1 Tax=Hyphobacterium sp. TaxID=2004662 RepID=UPI003BADA5A9
MTNEIDFHIGKRLRRRRRLLGMTQQQLAESVGIRFQQIQKYECGANRVSASRLFELSRSLDVPAQYFYDGLVPDDEEAGENEDAMAADILSQKETMDLVRAYYRLGERPRKRLLELAKSLEPSEPANDAA